MLRRTQVFWLKAGNISNRIPLAVATPVVEAFVADTYTPTPPARRLSSSGALRIAKKRSTSLENTTPPPQKEELTEIGDESAASLTARYVASWPSVQSAMFVADSAMVAASRLDSAIRGGGLGIPNPPTPDHQQEVSSPSQIHACKARAANQTEPPNPLNLQSDKASPQSACGHRFNSVWDSMASQVPTMPAMPSIPYATATVVADANTPNPPPVAERSTAMVVENGSVPMTTKTTAIDKVNTHTSPVVVQKEVSSPSSAMGSLVSVVGGTCGSAATAIWSCVPSATSLPSLPTSPVAATMGSGGAAATAASGMMFRILTAVSGGRFQYFYEAASKVTGLIWAIKMVAIFIVGCGVVIEGARAVKAVLEVLVLAKKLASE